MNASLASAKLSTKHMLKPQESTIQNKIVEQQWHDMTYIWTDATVALRRPPTKHVGGTFVSCFTTAAFATVPPTIPITPTRSRCACATVPTITITPSSWCAWTVTVPIPIPTPLIQTGGTGRKFVNFAEVGIKVIKFAEWPETSHELYIHISIIWLLFVLNSRCLLLLLLVLKPFSEWITKS